MCTLDESSTPGKEKAGAGSLILAGSFESAKGSGREPRTGGALLRWGPGMPHR